MTDLMQDVAQYIEHANAIHIEKKNLQQSDIITPGAQRHSEKVIAEANKGILAFTRPFFQVFCLVEWTINGRLHPTVSEKALASAIREFMSTLQDKSSEEQFNAFGSTPLLAKVMAYCETPSNFT